MCPRVREVAPRHVGVGAPPPPSPPSIHPAPERRRACPQPRRAGCVRYAQCRQAPTPCAEVWLWATAQMAHKEWESTREFCVPGQWRLLCPGTRRDACSWTRTSKGTLATRLFSPMGWLSSSAGWVDDGREGGRWMCTLTLASSFLLHLSCFTRSTEATSKPDHVGEDGGQEGAVGCFGRAVGI